MSEPVTGAAVWCRDVTVRIGRRTILNRVTCQVQPGEIAGLLGPNGAGKSTLFRVMAGLLRPVEGEVRLFGQPAGVESLADTALLPDRGRLPDWLTPGEWIEYAERLFPDWDMDRAKDLHERLEVPLGTPIRNLSRGQEARLGLLTCLARRARVVLLDEPFAGVDLVSRERISDTVVRELAGGDRAFVIATHDIRELESLFDRVILLGGGRVVEEALVEDLRRRGSAVEQRYREVFGG
jgi:ABC-2 type transport system ATP-binding protein